MKAGDSLPYFLQGGKKKKAGSEETVEMKNKRKQDTYNNSSSSSLDGSSNPHLPTHLPKDYYQHMKIYIFDIQTWTQHQAKASLLFRLVSSPHFFPSSAHRLLDISQCWVTRDMAKFGQPETKYELDDQRLAAEINAVPTSSDKRESRTPPSAWRL